MIKKVFDNFEEIAGSIFLAAICVVAAIQVFSRHLFSRPFSWTEELATCLFVYLTFIGASLALKRSEHFSVEILTDRLPKKIRFIVKRSIPALVFISCAIVTYYGCRMAIRGWHVRTPALEVRASVPYAAIPLGGALMMIRSLQHIFKRKG